MDRKAQTGNLILQITMENFQAISRDQKRADFKLICDIIP